MNKIDGKQIAAETLEVLKKLPRTNKFFAAILVEKNPASESFIKLKKKTAEEIGVDFRVYKYPDSISADKLRKEVVKISSHKTCGAVLVQLPLPAHINRHTILNAIPREKDIDVLGERALGAFYTSRNIILPPVVGTAIKILHHAYKLTFVPEKTAHENADEILSKMKTETFAIVGPGFLIGKPIATFLMGKTAGLHIFGSKSDLALLKNSDVVILGVGHANLIKPTMLKPNTIVIDFGYAEVAGKITGDFDATNIPKNFIGLYTPVPGGAGPVLIAQLFENFFELVKHQK